MDIAEQIQAELKREVENLREEQAQIHLLVKDAIVKLTDSFNGLRDQSNAQESMVSTLISTMEDDGDAEEGDEKRINIRQFVTETDQILRAFVDHIILVSRQSMEMVHRIDDLFDQMGEIAALLQDVKAIADLTNVLALNARIVAARSGEAGKAFAVVADEVRKLSRRSEDFSDRINTVVVSSQDNIRTAKGIIEQMASKDMSFAIESKGRVDDMMDEVSEIDRYTAETLSKVSTITETINQSVGLAIMSLQFEDMVTQLTQNMNRKFDMLGDFPDRLAPCLQEGMSQEDRAQMIDGIVAEQRQAFDQADSSAVEQGSMDEGDIELF